MIQGILPEIIPYEIEDGEEIKEKKEIADKLSVKNFDFGDFKNVGSVEWKSLIIAAQRLYEKETVSNSGSEPKNCILCRQALTDKEKTLFGFARKTSIIWVIEYFSSMNI